MLEAGFEIDVIEDACRGIDTQDSLAKTWADMAWADMASARANRIQSGDIAV